MKKVLFLVFMALVAGNIYSQQQTNPDGDVISLHVSPMINAFRLGNYGYTESMSFDVKLKIPAGNNITYAIFYERESYQFEMPDIPSTFFWFKKVKIGATLSIYFQ